MFDSGINAEADSASVTTTASGETVKSFLIGNDAAGKRYIRFGYQIWSSLKFNLCIRV